MVQHLFCNTTTTVDSKKMFKLFYMFLLKFFCFYKNSFKKKLLITYLSTLMLTQTQAFSLKKIEFLKQNTSINLYFDENNATRNDKITSSNNLATYEKDSGSNESIVINFLQNPFFSSINIKPLSNKNVNFLRKFNFNDSDFEIMTSNYSNDLKTPLQPTWNHPFLGLLLVTMTLVTICGNSLVIYAVVKERYLKSATNYYIASLACADLLVGLVVMPFNSLNKMTNDFWFFGDIWCDLWHSFDVFGSTASINSLLFIALDRHSAISDPISYHTGWLTRYWIVFVAIIWIGSACISFPAIAYWRWITIAYIENQCNFPDDIYYLVFSSLVSFYIPLIIMVVVYIRIYKTATQQVNALKSGQKLNVKTGDGSQNITLRIHRGGYRKLSMKFSSSNTIAARIDKKENNNSKNKIIEYPVKKECVVEKKENRLNNENQNSTKIANKLITDCKKQPKAKTFKLINPLSLSLSKLQSKRLFSNQVDVNVKNDVQQFSHPLRRYASCKALFDLDKTIVDIKLLSELKNDSKEINIKNKLEPDEGNYRSILLKSSFYNTLYDDKVSDLLISNTINIKRSEFDLKKINATSLNSLSSFNLTKQNTINFLYYPILLSKKAINIENDKYSTEMTLSHLKNSSSSKFVSLSSKFNLSSLASLNNLSESKSTRRSSLANQNSNSRKSSLIDKAIKEIIISNPVLVNQSNADIYINKTNDFKSEISLSNNPKVPSNKNKLISKANNLYNKVSVKLVKKRKPLLNSISKKESQDSEENKVIFTQSDYDLYTLDQIKLTDSSPDQQNQNKGMLGNNKTTSSNHIIDQKIKMKSSNYQLNAALEHYQNHYYEHNLNLKKSHSRSLTSLDKSQAQNQCYFFRLFRRYFDLSKMLFLKRDKKKDEVFESNQNRDEGKKRKSIFNKIKIGKKLRKFSHEQKAAKTLGIVMGVFIICWLPFFIYNVITGIFKAKSHEFIYSVLTWLGYVNSGCNPIIYAFSSRDFRKAFSKILCSSKFNKNHNMINNQNMYRKNLLKTSIANSQTMNKTNRSDSCENEYFALLKNLKPVASSELKINNSKSIDCDLCQVYEHVYFKYLQTRNNISVKKLVTNKIGENVEKNNKPNEFEIKKEILLANETALSRKSNGKSVSSNSSLSYSTGVPPPPPQPMPIPISNQQLNLFSSSSSATQPPSPILYTKNNQKKFVQSNPTFFGKLRNSFNRRIQTRMIKRTGHQSLFFKNSKTQNRYNPECAKRYISNTNNLNNQQIYRNASCSSTTSFYNYNNSNSKNNSFGKISREDFQNVWTKTNFSLNNSQKKNQTTGHVCIKVGETFKFKQIVDKDRIKKEETSNSSFLNSTNSNIFKQESKQFNFTDGRNSADFNNKDDDYDDDESYFIQINTNILKNKQQQLQHQSNQQQKVSGLYNRDCCKNDENGNDNDFKNEDLKICIQNFKAIINNLKETYVDEINEDEFTRNSTINTNCNRISIQNDSNENDPDLKIYQNVKVLSNDNNQFISYFEI